MNKEIEDIVTALNEAVTILEEKEVKVHEKYLHVTPAMKDIIDNTDNTDIRAIVSRFAGVIVHK